jgi:hypothetical protein
MMKHCLIMALHMHAYGKIFFEIIGLSEILSITFCAEYDRIDFGVFTCKCLHILVANHCG